MIDKIEQIKNLIILEKLIIEQIKKNLMTKKAGLNLMKTEH